MTEFATTDPTTGSVIKEFDTMTDADVDHCLHTAHAAYLAWRRTDLTERIELLQQIADRHREHSDKLARMMTLEIGKPISQAKAEVVLAASIYEYYASKGETLLAGEVIDIAGKGSAVVLAEPVGPLLGVMPWNFPYYQVARFAAPNLLLGNTILLKHAPSCPQQALQIADTVTAAGAPTGVYQNLFATNEQVAAMIAGPLLQGVSLTGSERAGRAIGSVAGAHMKKCVLELGGSDPFIVLADADVPVAAREAATGRFLNAGQACSSPKRILVEEVISEQFLAELLIQAKKWTIGDPSSSETKLGPMASSGARRDRRPGLRGDRPTPVAAMSRATSSSACSRCVAHSPSADLQLQLGAVEAATHVDAVANGWGLHRSHSG